MHAPLTFVAECLQRASLRPGCAVFLPIHHTKTVEVVPDFPLRFPNGALRQDRFVPFVRLRRSGDPS